jgi:hypothetical protein
MISFSKIHSSLLSLLLLQAVHDLFESGVSAVLWLKERSHECILQKYLREKQGHMNPRQGFNSCFPH